MRKVLTYSDYGELDRYEFYEGIRDCLHIPVSTKFGLKLKNDGYFNNIISFESMLKRIDSNWVTPSMKMSTLSLISEIIREKISLSTDDNERSLLYTFQKDLFSVWSAIILLEESDVLPDDLPLINEKLIILYDIWKYVVVYENEFERFRNSMDEKNLVKNITDILIKISDNRITKQIVIHGFYFFTPIQERLMRILEKAGYELIFLVNYHKKYSDSLDILEYLYFNDEIYEIEYFESEMYKNHFGDIHVRELEDSPNLILREYETPMDFVRDLDNNPKSVAIFSPDSKVSNNLLNKFHPEFYGKRTIVSYPVGKFLLLLHRLINPETQEIEIECDNIKECFASGWIAFESHNSNEYLFQLEKILPFFKNCKSLNEWDLRLTLLHEINNDVVSRYNSTDKGDGTRRMENVLGNPFNNFGVFDVSVGELNIIIRMIRRLIECARTLYGKRQGCTIGTHINRMVDILNDECDNSKTLYDQFELVKKILDEIDMGESDKKFLPVDIAKAVTSYLNNEYTPLDPNSINTDDWVRPLFDVDSCMTDAIHICLTDNNRLPGKVGKYVWPLDATCIDQIISNQEKYDSRPLANNIKFIIETRPIANRYLLYKAFNHSRIILSWIKVENNKINTPSSYIELLSKKYDIGVDKVRNDVKLTNMSTISQRNRLFTDFKFNNRDSIPEMRIEYCICHKRYLYSYILNENPSYISEFHYGFAIGGLINALLKLHAPSHVEKQLIINNVFELFPHLTTVEKQNILDLSPNSRDDYGTYFNKKSYTDVRLDVKFPPTIRHNVSKLLNVENFEEAVDLMNIEGVSDFCMYCPHISFCPDSKYSGDD